jgi:hypothetical protein
MGTMTGTALRLTKTQHFAASFHMIADKDANIEVSSRSLKSLEIIQF